MAATKKRMAMVAAGWLLQPGSIWPFRTIFASKLGGGTSQRRFTSEIPSFLFSSSQDLCEDPLVPLFLPRICVKKQALFKNHLRPELVNTGTF